MNLSNIKNIEEICLARRHCIAYKRQPDFSDFMYMEGRLSKKDKVTKYNLSNIRNEADLKLCLGIEFLELNPFLLEIHERTKDYKELSGEMSERRKTLRHEFNNFGPFNHFNNIEMPNNHGFKIYLMNIQESIRITFMSINDIAQTKEMNNYTPLIEEWKSFASKNNVNLDDVFEQVIVRTEKNRKFLDFFTDLQNDFNKLSREVMEFIRESHFMLREFYPNRRDLRNDFIGYESFNHNDISFQMDKMDKAEALLDKHVKDSGYINTLNDFETKLKAINNRMIVIIKDLIKNDVNHEEAIETNDLFIESLHAAYLMLKDYIKIPEKYCEIPVQAISFVNKMKKRPYNEVDMKDYITKNKNKLFFVADHIVYNNVHYEKVALFVDESCAVLVKGSENFEYFINIKNMKDIVKLSMIGYIKHVLRKNPTMSKTVVERFEKQVENNKRSLNNSSNYKTAMDYERMLLCIETYFKNENILKSIKFNFLDNLASSKNLEALDDNMHKIIREHNIKKYAESIVSNKYKHLYNAESYKLFKELYDLKIDIKIIQEMLGKKLAAVESEEMFNKNIQSLINSFNDFNIDAIKVKAKSAKAKIISENDQVLILEIENFEQSKYLGSASWCISRNPSYFTNYTLDGSKQYFIYDFKVSSKSVKSLVGITVTKKMTIKAAHTKSDSELKDKAIKDYLISKLKAIEDAKKPVIELPVGVIKKAKKSNNSNITNVNVSTQNEIIIGF